MVERELRQRGHDTIAPDLPCDDDSAGLAEYGDIVVCATYPGTGAAVPPSQAALQAGHDFPADQTASFAAFKAAISEYPAAPAAPAGTKGAQGIAVADWWDGTDTTGHKIARISAPTLIADGTEDQLDPAPNDHILARLIPRATLVLYPDAGHGFCSRKERASLPSSDRS